MLDMQQNCMFLPSFLSACLQEGHSVTHTTELHVSITLFVCLPFSKQTLLKGIFNESFFIQNGLEDKIRYRVLFLLPKL